MRKDLALAIMASKTFKRYRVTTDRIDALTISLVACGKEVVADASIHCSNKAESTELAKQSKLSRIKSMR